ncbi:MAG: beta-galactosidase [Chloroflexi bacterium]|nr:beta-galactosidase [Chloroflexota bacterium]
MKLFEKLWHGADYNYEQWLDSPDILAEDFRLMRLTHSNVMSIGIFAWSMLEPTEDHYTFDWLDQLVDSLAENGLSAILATPSAAPPAWLSQKYPETRRVNEHGIRQPHRRRQNFCYSSPVYREKIVALNTRLAERYQHHPALVLWHVSNEYVATQCHCDLCYHSFRAWLQRRYSDLDTLNRAWWSTFWSHRYTDWSQIEPVDPSMHSLMLDWQRFTSDQALEFFLAESAPLRQITPDIPITTNFMQPDVGLNYWNFAPHVDVACWDSYPRWHQTDDLQTAMQTAFYHDLHRSYKQGQPFLLMESTPSVTNWQGISRLKKPGMHKLSSLQAVAHGANSVQYFQWRQSRGGEEKFHGAVVSHLASTDTRVFQDVQALGNLLEKLIPVTETTIQAPVALIYDFENEWALNHAQLPRSIGKNYQETCRQHYRPFWQQGIAVDIINTQADFSAYRLVIAPMLYMLPPGMAERIEAYVKAGGTFVTTYLSGLVNQSDLVFLNGYPPPLRRTLGLYSEEMDTLTDHQLGQLRASPENPLNLHGDYEFHHYAELVHAETAQVLATYHSEFYAGYPVLTANAYGSGQAYFIAARTENRFLIDFYTQLAECMGIENPLHQPLPAGLSMQVRSDESQRFAFIMNFTDHAIPMEIGQGWQDSLTGLPSASSITVPPYDVVIVGQAL